MWHDMFEDKDRSFGDGVADGFLGVPNIHPNDLDYSIGHLLADDTPSSSSSESQVQVSARSSDGGDEHRCDYFRTFHFRRSDHVGTVYS